ncbi:MAG: hypothetical protein GX593_05605 [Actinomycetales bacterium]|nr:hypothetical protein [Actinomycetales bacterium]
MTAPSPTPTTTPPASGEPRRSRFLDLARRWTIGGVLGLVVTAIAAWQWLPGMFNTLQDAANRPAAPATAEALTDAELESVKLTGAEMWTGENGSYWVLHVDATAFDRDLVGAMIEVEAVDASDAAIGEGETFTMIRKGETTVLAGALEPTADGVDLDAQTVGFRTSTKLQESLRTDPGLELVEAEIDPEPSVVGLKAYVAVRAAEETNATVTVIVRDADGELLQIASRRFIDVSAVTQDADIMLTALDVLPEGHTVEYVVNPS